MSRNSKRSDCPIHISLNTLGDRWTLVLIRDLMFSDRATFGELQNAPEKIASNILADRLKKLLHAGIATKAPDNNRYYLTDKGWDLLPVLIELLSWGANHEETDFDASDSIASYRKNPQRFINALRKEREQTSI